jgi:nucleoside-diphosphate kinase
VNRLQEKVVAAFLASHHGVLSRADAESLGMGDDQVDGCVRSGRWTVVHRDGGRCDHEAARVSAVMNRSLVICKPDAVERRLVGEILGRLERKGLRIVAAELRQLDPSIASVHYREHEGKPFFDDLIAFITRSPAVLVVVEGPVETWRVVRTLMGVTNPADAAPGTIRGDLGLRTTENLVHGSDGPESAAREIGLFFPHLAS